MLKTIKKDDQCAEVFVARCLLETEEMSDIFDDALVEKVKAFQTANSITPDGVIGAKTWTALAAKAPTVSVKKYKFSSYASAVQTLIGGLKVDGIYGPKTRAAVMTFQAASGLVADGICGPKTWSVLITGEKPADVPSGSAQTIQPVDFKQYDKRWADKMYSNHGDKSQTMRSSACGPTSMADIVAQWWDKTITPYDLALKSIAWGCRTKDSGTLGSFFTKCQKLYKASKYLTTASIETAIQCLNTGGYVVVCFGPGTKGKAWYQKWTKGGHYCVLWKWDGENFRINDPASSAERRAIGTREEVLNCRKSFYCFWK
ncbi:MAG: peptidoglycan-binding protein [Lachnospiraceae bacterium]|nr:peptidoglycan-binding protein [Lachnospiraceae bacterium]